MQSSFYKQHSLPIRAGAAVVFVVALKVVAHLLGWEVLSSTRSSPASWLRTCS